MCLRIFLIENCQVCLIVEQHTPDCGIERYQLNRQLGGIRTNTHTMAIDLHMSSFRLINETNREQILKNGNLIPKIRTQLLSSHVDPRRHIVNKFIDCHNCLSKNGTRVSTYQNHVTRNEEVCACFGLGF